MLTKIATDITTKFDILNLDLTDNVTVLYDDKRFKFRVYDRKNEHDDKFWYYAKTMLNRLGRHTDVINALATPFEERDM